MAWITSKGLMQEAVIDPHTGLKRVVSVKVSGNGKKAQQEAQKRLTSKIMKLYETRFKLSETVDIYLNEMGRTWKPSSFTRISSHFKSILEILGDGYMNNISAGYIRQKFTDSGKSNRTINDYQKTLKTFWRWAYRNDFVQSPEVADKLTTLKDQPKKERIQDKYLETGEIKRLLEAMTEERFRLATEFMLLTGVRVNEFSALNKTDVWGSIVRINKTYDRANRIITEPKSYTSKREIHVQPELKECINKINKFCNKQKEIFEYDSVLFFPDVDGGYFPYQIYNRYLKRISEEVIGRPLTPHALRHTHCSQLAAKGYSLDAISARLGHEDSKITREIYFHRLKELKDRENEVLDSIRIIT